MRCPHCTSNLRNVKAVCRYVGLTMIREQLPNDPRVIRYLTPGFLEEFSESCEI